MEQLAERALLEVEELERLCPGVTRRSLQRDLKGLMEKGLVVSEGEARATRYYLAVAMPRRNAT